MTKTNLNSAHGVLSLLEEEDLQLKELSLKRMTKDNFINDHWAEISQSIRKM
jgi:hypothetical protein